MFTKHRTIFILSLLLVITIAIVFSLQLISNKKPKIKDFASCIKAGYPVVQTYPRSCEYSKELRFVEPLSASDQAKLKPANP